VSVTTLRVAVGRASTPRVAKDGARPRYGVAGGARLALECGGGVQV